MLWDSLAQESIKERFRQQLHESDQKLRGEWAADRSAAVAAEVAKTTAVQEQYKQLEAAQAAQRESLGKQTEAAAILGEQLKADGAKHQAEKVRVDSFVMEGSLTTRLEVKALTTRLEVKALTTRLGLRLGL